jgi:hypothetical protein
MVKEREIRKCFHIINGLRMELGLRLRMASRFLKLEYQAYVLLAEGLHDSRHAKRRDYALVAELST